MRIILCVLLSIACMNYNHWKIGDIYNDSDLVFESVYYCKPREKEIRYLTDIIRQSFKKIPMNYTVDQSSKGCCLIKAKNGYSLLLDSYPGHAIYWGRVKASNKFKKHIGKECCNLGGYCARVFIEQKDIEKPLAYGAKGFSDQPTKFDLKITGSNGNYQLEFLK